jgi:hypothetical protein
VPHPQVFEGAGFEFFSATRLHLEAEPSHANPSPWRHFITSLHPSFTFAYDASTFTPRHADKFTNSLSLETEMNFLSLAAILLALLPIPAATPSLAPAPPTGIGSLTLMDGSVRIIRGVNVLKGVEGMRLRQGDILESSDVGFAQLEFTVGAVVALGPASRLYILRHTGDKPSAAKDTAELALLSGWLKAESAASSATGAAGGAGTYRYETPTLAATTSAGTVLIHASQDESEIFLESGAATIAEVREDGNVRQPVPAKAGQFFTRHAAKNIATTMRPNPAFIDAMPKPFRDTLPPRLEHFAGKSVEPKTDHLVSYADAEPYLHMPLAWRRGIADRFQSRLKDPEFRKQIEAHIAQYPEWDKILHPEPKEPADKPASSTNPS